MSGKKLKVERAAFGYGFSLRDNGQPFSSTATVARVEPGGAADRAGMRVGDRIRSINGQPVQSMTFLEASNAVRVSSQCIELELDGPTEWSTARSDSPLRTRTPTNSAQLTGLDHLHSGARTDLESCELTPITSVSERTINISISPGSETESTLSAAAAATSPTTVDSFTGPTGAPTTLSPGDPISSHPCTNLYPTRLSLHVPHNFHSPSDGATPTTTTTTTAVTANASDSPAHTPSTRPVPLLRRMRTPLATVNQSQEPRQTDINPRTAVNLTASTPSNHICSTVKESIDPTSPSAIFEASHMLTEDSRHQYGDDSVIVGEHNRSKEDSSLSTVRVRPTDGNVTKKAHRRQTFTRACLDGDGPPDAGMPIVRFVRKRAYASARQAGRFDQFAAFNHATNHGVQQAAGIPSTLANVEATTSPCQLLPADPQPVPSNVLIVEPKITHLPRRRSSKSRTNRPSTGMRRSRVSSEYKRVEDMMSSTDSSGAVIEAASAHSIPVDQNLDVKTESVCSPESVIPSGESTEPHSETLTMNRTQIAEHSTATTTTTDKSLRSTNRLWASCDSDQNENPLDWWTRAGETYQQLDLEYQRLMKRKSRLQHRQTPNGSELGDEFNLGSNKENKADGSVRSDKREPRGPVARMSASISSHATWSSPISRRDKSPVFLLGTSQTDGSESQLSTHSGSVRRRQLRNLCSGLRYHRSESNIHHDVSGSFHSRQSLCKILALAGSTNKSFSWKPYCMCIAGSEVRFVKACSSFSAANRKSKSIKQLTDAANATRNLGAVDLIDEQHFSDGSLNTSRSGLSGADCQPTTSSSCVVLPLPGLIWTQEQVPQDLPSWRPLAPSVPPTSTRKPSPVPDIMDPSHSGLSEPTDSVANPTVPVHTKPTSNEDSVLRTMFQCYRFAHLGAGVELLFVFPDKNTAMACLNMCERYGGHEAFLDSRIPSDPELTNRKPYDLLFLSRTQSKCGPTASNNLTKSEAPNHLTKPGSVGERIRPEISRPTVAVVTAPCIPHCNAQYKLTDRRQRRMDKQSALHEGTITRILDSPIPPLASAVCDHPIAANSVAQDDLSASTSTSHADGVASMDDKSNQRSTKSRNAPPFLRGFKQWLNRPAFPASSAGTVEQQSVSSAPTAPVNLETKLAAVLGDPPDLSEFECSGDIFGAPLEKQIPSPDHACVPVLLHALVLGLETHGLHLSGLYRKSGRHLTIAQFVCVTNLVPSNINLWMKLDAWREPNALCGLVKQYLRRLPDGLFIPATWEPLALLVDSHASSDASKLAYLLLSIRVKLRKLASEAFGIPTGHLIPGPNSPEGLSEMEPSPGGVGSSQPPRLSPSSSPSGCSPDFCSDDRPVANTLAAWRWATLCYLVAHIRDVVALRHLNDVSFQCIAICFGPVLFGDSTNLAKLNGVLENLLRHWHWLVQGLPLVTYNTLSSPVPVTEKIMPEYTLAEAINYLEQYQSASNVRVPSPVTAERSPSTGRQGSSDMLESMTGSDIGSPMLRSSDDQLNTQPLSPDTTAEHNDYVCHVVRSLLERAVEASTVEKLGERHQGAEPSTTALHRVLSAVSSHSHASVRHNNEAGHPVSGRRRKTMDAHNARSLNSTVQVDYRRPKPGRIGLNPRHLDPIQGQSATNNASAQSPEPNNSVGSRHADGVIPRPSIPSRTYRSVLPFDQPSLTKSPS